MNSRPVFQSSPELTATNVKQAKFPWSELKPGMSWSIKYSEVGYGTLKSMASRFGMKLGYKFKVVDRGPDTGYEVGCLELTQADIEFRKAKNKEGVEIRVAPKTPWHEHGDALNAAKAKGE